MMVLHANWTADRLWIWAESASTWEHVHAGVLSSEKPAPHPFAASADEVRAIVTALPGGAALDLARGSISLRLPSLDARPMPSTKLAHALGHRAASEDADQDRPVLAAFSAHAIGIAPADAWRVLDAIEDTFGAAARDELEGSAHDPDEPASIVRRGVLLDSTIDFFLAAARFTRHLLAQQRFVPAMKQMISGELRGLWLPWLSDSWTAERVGLLMSGMPPSARAPIDAAEHQPWPILEGFLIGVIDAECRRTLRIENMSEAIQEREPLADSHVAWLSGLLAQGDAVPTRGPQRNDLIKHVRHWISTLEERGASSLWRLMFRLAEPPDAVLVGDVDDPEDDCVWTLSFHLQNTESTRIVVDAPDIWSLAADQVTIEGKRLESPQELLLKELGRASRLYKKLEGALGETEPVSLELTTKQAYEFLREIKPILQEQGFAVLAPEWWDLPSARLGARLKLSSESLEVIQAGQGPGPVNSSGARLGLGALVNYTWDISLGGMTLSLAEFEKLAAKRTPLVRINGRWVEIRPEDVRAAVKFIQENPGGEMRVGDAIRMAYDSDVSVTGVPIVGLEADGWVGAFFGSAAGVENQAMPAIEPPRGFHGSLRPYQLRGVSWLAFLERFGFGPCLADDMGLGKTIQLLALLAHEREALQMHAGTPAPGHEGEALAAGAPSLRASVPPSLLIVPMSVVGNWVHETKRFCPELRILMHHGVDRLQGEAFKRAALESDAVITTYSLAHRDRETLGQVHWHRIVLDEAQYVKNPTTKQSLAVRGLSSTTRIALTGTPVENRLSELWSILDFLNPGYLGSAHNFRKRFSVPVERYHDAHRGKQLKELVRPFLLRRLKSDPTVAADLPEKVETREFCHLTPEQAELYETTVRRMLAAVEAAEGIQRRGLVLSTLVKLKQICNHPAQMLKEGPLSDADDDAPGAPPPGPILASRSGKCVRLLELLDEVIAGGEQALVFTQFRQMGELLGAMLRQELDREVLFLHGGTAQGARVSMVEKFQKGQVPILLVSLKAGGVGLNLTAATHVFHFDRWWNPAVENQATDRAHRIGQYRTVQVHKFVVRGTLEERIDAMIEQKTELAERIIGSGESWLTELSTDQLRDMLTLRKDAVGDEG
jgi:SNF2 family DNA or RNA helicase